MNYKTGIERFADFMKNTYIRKDIDIKLALLKGKDDPSPKKTGAKFNITLNLAEACAIGAGIAALGLLAYECCKKSCEARLIRKMLDEIELEEETED